MNRQTITNALAPIPNPYRKQLLRAIFSNGTPFVIMAEIQVLQARMSLRKWWSPAHASALDRVIAMLQDSTPPTLQFSRPKAAHRRRRSGNTAAAIILIIMVAIAVAIMAPILGRLLTSQG